MQPFNAALASENKVYGVPAVAAGPSKGYVEVSCTDQRINFLVQWMTDIGTAGKYRRHLLLPGELGNKHILLRVMPDKTSTGIMDNDLRAKSLIRLILRNIQTDYFLLEVFPEGRDGVTGEWEHIEFRTGAVLTAINRAAKECNWDPAESKEVLVPTVLPGAPYDGE
jgi:hypothetical protein